MIPVPAKAGGPHHDIREPVLLKRVKKRVIPPILWNDDNAIEGLIADDLFEIIREVWVFVSLNLEPKAVTGSMYYRQNTLLQIVEQRGLVNNVCVLGGRHHQ